MDAYTRILQGLRSFGDVSEEYQQKVNTIHRLCDLHEAGIESIESQKVIKDEVVTSMFELIRRHRESYENFVELIEQQKVLNNKIFESISSEIEAAIAIREAYLNADQDAAADNNPGKDA